MDTKEYFNRASEKLENMSDEEFLGLLKKSGIDDCPPRDLSLIHISEPTRPY